MTKTRPMHIPLTLSLASPCCESMATSSPESVVHDVQSRHGRADTFDIAALPSFAIALL